MENKETVYQHIQIIADQFKQNYHLYTQPLSDYNETQLRADFINQFWHVLGWNVYNEKQVPQYLREGIQEDRLRSKRAGNYSRRESGLCYATWSGMQVFLSKSSDLLYQLSFL